MHVLLLYCCWRHYLASCMINHIWPIGMSALHTLVLGLVWVIFDILRSANITPIVASMNI